MKYERHKHILLSCLTAFVMIGSVVLLYETFLDGDVFNKPIQFKNTQLQTTETIYHPGDIVKAKISFCKDRIITPTVKWELIDTWIRFYPNKAGGLAMKGCFTNHEISLEPLPRDLLPGTYYFAASVIYQVNPLNSVEYNLTTNKFTVEK